MIIQSFETANLRKLSRMTDVKLAQLLDAAGRPYDFVVAGDPRTYQDLVTPAGLKWIAGYADGIGANKNLLVPRDAAGALLAPTDVIRDAHRDRADRARLDVPRGEPVPRRPTTGSAPTRTRAATSPPSTSSSSRSASTVSSATTPTPRSPPAPPYPARARREGPARLTGAPGPWPCHGPGVIDMGARPHGPVSQRPS